MSRDPAVSGSGRAAQGVPAAEPCSLAYPGSRASHRYRPTGKGKSAAWLTLEVEFAPQGVLGAFAEIVARGGGRSYVRPTVIARNSFRLTLRAQPDIEEVVLHVEGSGDLERPVRARLTSRSTVSALVSLTGLALRRMTTNPRALLSSAVWFLERSAGSRAVVLPEARGTVSEAQAYGRWCELFDHRPEEDAGVLAERVRRLARRPLISVLLAAESEADLASAVADMASQVYPEWELVAVAAPAPAPALTPPLEDGRIRLVPGRTVTRAGRLNEALRIARGDIVVALSPGGRLRPHALLEAASAFETRPGTAMLYADEDAIGPEGLRASPRFKPAWSLHLAQCHDYMGDPVFFDAAVLRSVAGWREGRDGAEDHDLKLRVAERASGDRVLHLAQILLHRQSGSEQRASGADASRFQVVADGLSRTGMMGQVVRDGRTPHPRIVRSCADAPLASLIVPTRDRAALLRLCVTTLLERTRYPAFEIVVVDNGSKEPETFELFRELERDDRVRILPAPGLFNYAALNNAAARVARGSILALVNNDIEVLSEDWLDEMVGLALEPSVGCVGAKLYYPDGTIQHAGIVTGLLGGAGHADKHAPREARGYLDRLVTVREVSAVTGACLVVRRALYDTMGGLDEAAFKIAFNDVDFCLRVAAAGFRTLWTPFAELIHHESVSRGHDLTDRAKARRLAEELAALQERWGLRLLWDPYHSPHLDPRSEASSIRVS